jgi:enoyl-[acyl-carrier protein] reductase I
VLELDVNDPVHLEAVAEELASRWGRVDGAVHAIAFAPADALGGDFLATPRASAATAFETSAYSFKALTQALAPLMEDGGGIVGLDFDATVAWPSYDWMGVAKAALESVNRYLARDLGPSAIRANLVSAGPVHTTAALDPRLRRARRPVGAGRAAGLDPRDLQRGRRRLPVPARRCPGRHGEIVHVDGGYHAVGALGASTRPATTAPTEPEPTGIWRPPRMISIVMALDHRAQGLALIPVDVVGAIPRSWSRRMRLVASATKPDVGSHLAGGIALAEELGGEQEHVLLARPRR